MVNRVWQSSQDENEGSADEQELALVVDNLVEQLLRGADLHLSNVLQEHRRYATELREVFPVIQALSECCRQRRQFED